MYSYRLHLDLSYGCFALLVVVPLVWMFFGGRRKP